MLMLDKTQPHSTISGLPGVIWEQGGVLFNQQGFPVDEAGNPIEVAAPAAPDSDSGSMSMDDLKAMAAVYGIEGADKMTRRQLEKALEAK